MITYTNQYIIRAVEGKKRQALRSADLGVNYEDYIACKDILARYNA